MKKRRLIIYIWIRDNSQGLFECSITYLTDQDVENQEQSAKTLCLAADFTSHNLEDIKGGMYGRDKRDRPIIAGCYGMTQEKMQSFLNNLCGAACELEDDRGVQIDFKRMDEFEFFYI